MQILAVTKTTATLSLVPVVAALVAQWLTSKTTVRTLTTQLTAERQARVEERAAEEERRTEERALERTKELRSDRRVQLRLLQADLEGLTYQLALALTSQKRGSEHGFPQKITRG